MKDVSQCLLSIIDEFDKYHSKIISLEDENQSYDKNVKTLTSTRDKLLENKKENLMALQDKEKESESLVVEHEKLQARYKYVRKITEELRDENAHMNARVLRSEDENLQQYKRIQSLEKDLAISKTKEPKNVVHLFTRLENLKTELILAKQELKFLPRVQSENIQLKARCQEIVESSLSRSAQEKTMHLEYIKMKKEKDHVLEKLKHLESEYNDLNKLYNKSLHDKELLKKKAEDLILQKYNKMYEPKHLFGIDMHTLKGQQNYVDIDSLIDGIDEKDTVPLKALA